MLHQPKRRRMNDRGVVARRASLAYVIQHSDEIALLILLHATNVYRLPGTNENISFSPNFALNVLSLTCKSLRDFIKKDSEGENYLGLRWAKEAGIRHAELKKKLSLIDSDRKLFSDTDFKGIRVIVTEIFKQFPPEETIFIGLGNSPAPVLSLIKHKAPMAKIINLPLGNILPTECSSQSGGPFLTTQLYWNAYKEHFTKYFNNFFADPISVKLLNSYLLGEKIAVIDYVITGHSLRLVRDLICFYLVDQLLAKYVENLINEFQGLDLSKKIEIIKNCKKTLYDYGLTSNSPEELTPTDIGLLYDKDGKWIYEVSAEKVFTTFFVHEYYKDKIEEEKKKITAEVLSRVSVFAMLSPPSSEQQQAIRNETALKLKSQKYAPLAENNYKTMLLKGGNNHANGNGNGCLSTVANRLFKKEYKVLSHLYYFESKEIAAVKRGDLKCVATPDGLRLNALMESKLNKP